MSWETLKPRGGAGGQDGDKAEAMSPRRQRKELNELLDRLESF